MSRCRAILTRGFLRCWGSLGDGRIGGASIPTPVHRDKKVGGDGAGTSPRDALEQLRSRVAAARDQAAQALTTGVQSPRSRFVGDVVASFVLPHGTKGAARSAGRYVSASSKTNVRGRWLVTGRQLLIESDAVLRQVSVRSKTLPPSGTPRDCVQS